MADRPSGASRAAALVLIIVAVANFGYAGWRFWQGDTDNLPLIIGGTVCTGLAVVLTGLSRQRGQ